MSSLMIPRLVLKPLRYGPVCFVSLLIITPPLTPNGTGKDYSNPRILDFHTLNRPQEDMYDRAKIPRMPWFVFMRRKILYCLPIAARHDVGMQVVGQPARDLCRHFVQRWAIPYRLLGDIFSFIPSHSGGITCCESRSVCLCFNLVAIDTCCRITRESCHSFYPHQSLNPENWLQWASPARVRCKYVALQGLGPWAA